MTSTPSPGPTAFPGAGTPVAGGARPRPGRPPRISRARIAEAAHELGLEGLTLRAVADHLGVSIAALYHHVSSKDDLMRVAAEYSVARVPRPEDRGQHWAQWLWEWAEFNLHTFVSQPGLLTQYMDGAISAEAIAGSIDTILRVLVRQGFTILEANEAFELVSACAMGTAIATHRERALARTTWQAPGADENPEPAAEPGAPLRDLPHLHQLHEALATEGREPFHTRIATIIHAIALRQGLDLPSIRAILKDTSNDGSDRQG